MSRPLSGVYAVLLAGGLGERLWPLSTRTLPKPFLDLGGGRSLLRRTFDRLAGWVPTENVLVVTGADYVPLVRQQLPELPAEQVIAEPAGRGTAPAVGLAGLWIQRRDPDPVLLALPVDHDISGPGRFRVAMQAAVAAARHGWLVTLGVTPSRPDTGYGYIQVGEQVAEVGALPLYRARRFVEKPDAGTARQFLAGGDFLWNSGMFAFTLRLFLAETARHLPDLHRLLTDIGLAAEAETLPVAIRERYHLAGTVSLDRGICERSDRVAVLPAQFGWSDMGDWAALGRSLPRDEDGNAVLGEAVCQDARGLVVYAGSGRLVVADGVEDLVIADTPEALLVTGKHRAQAVRQTAHRCGALARALAQDRDPGGQVVEQPWGREIRWADTDWFVARVLQIRPGHVLTRDGHRRRAESWLVQEGAGWVRIGDAWYPASPGATFTLPPGAGHRLEAVTPMTVIAVSGPEPDGGTEADEG